jgi:hypothetical protein
MEKKHHILLVRDRVDQRKKGFSKELSKIRVLAVERTLSYDRRITAKQIKRILDQKYDIQASTKSIYDDLIAIDRFVPLDVKSGYGGGYKMIDLREV